MADKDGRSNYKEIVEDESFINGVNQDVANANDDVKVIGYIEGTSGQLSIKQYYILIQHHRSLIDQDGGLLDKTNYTEYHPTDTDASDWSVHDPSKLNQEYDHYNTEHEHFETSHTTIPSLVSTNTPQFGEDHRDHHSTRENHRRQNNNNNDPPAVYAIIPEDDTNDRISSRTNSDASTSSPGL